MSSRCSFAVMVTGAIIVGSAFVGLVLAVVMHT